MASGFRGNGLFLTFKFARGHKTGFEAWGLLSETVRRGTGLR